MTAAEKKTVTMIYIAVAIIVIALIFVFIYIGKVSKQMQDVDEQARRDKVKADAEKRMLEFKQTMAKGVRYSEREAFLTIKNDYRAFNQDQREVGLMDLKGKVWVFAQFYSSCPECQKTNLKVLRELHNKYKDNSNFHIVTVSVDKEFDKFEALKGMEASMETTADKWWFLKCEDDEKLNEYVATELRYVKSQASTEDDEHSGKIAHDMGISVFDSELKMWAKVDLFGPSLRNDEVGVEEAKAKLYHTIEDQLNKLKN